MQKELLTTIIHLRVMQLYYHFCHHLVYNCAFHSDHSFFGDSYSRVDKDYDGTVEYLIGQNGPEAFKVAMVTELVAKQLKKYDIENMDVMMMHENALALEEELQKYLTSSYKKATIGLQNFLGDVATASDVRIYKLKQRMKSDEEAEEKEEESK